MECYRTQVNTTIFKLDLKLRHSEALGLSEFLFERSGDFYYFSNSQDCVLEKALTAIFLVGISE